MTLPGAQTSFWSVALVNVVLGVPAYFTCFLFAYGFEDDVRLANHVTFLVLIAIFAAVTGLVGACLPPARGPRQRRLAAGVLVSLALNAAVVGAGSIVSAQHTAEGSVSTGFSTTTDALLASGLFAAAVALAVAAVWVGRGPRRT